MCSVSAFATIARTSGANMEAKVIGTTFPVEGIADLASKVKVQRANLESQLNSLRSACQRDPNFSGSAATSYDNYMAEWDASQKQLLQALDGASNLLQRLAQTLQENDSRFASAFNG